MRWVLKNRYAPQTFIFCSHELKNELHDALISLCPDSAMEVIHNGVDTEVFKPLAKHHNPIPRVGIIANLQYRKGHNDFLEMAKKLDDQWVVAQFDIISGDILQEPREPYLKQHAKELGIADKVMFHGQLPDVKAELQKLDIVVCASHEEAFPISMLQAIVSTNVNVISVALTHQKDALLVSPHDPRALAMCVKQLLSSSSELASLGINAKQQVENHFSSEILTEKLLNLYNHS
jgi:glycosyltransferase involved in cell wall biosynthesis